MKEEKHIELHSKVFMSEPNLTPLFGYWKFDRFYQRWYHWMKTGTWPKREWVNGLIEAQKHIDSHKWVEERDDFEKLT